MWYHNRFLNGMAFLQGSAEDEQELPKGNRSLNLSGPA